MVTATVYLSRRGTPDWLAESALSFVPDDDRELGVVNLVPERAYQEILGFGGAFTETSAYNYARVTPRSQAAILAALFGPNGLRLNFCRTPIHSSDFSLDEYTYVADGDTTLATFSIDRDRRWILPFLTAAQAVADDLQLFASPWSPPPWMKTNREFNHGGRLDPAYAGVWADYIARYFTEYARAGVSFVGLTVQNEPLAAQTWESCQFTAEEEGRFVRDHLVPALDRAGFAGLKIMIWDHNKERVFERARDTCRVPGVAEHVWGIAFHWYSGDHFDALTLAHEAFPDKPLLLTECSLGASRGEVAPGPHSSWDGLEIKAKEMIGDFNHHTAAVVDWNLVVDEQGGPYHSREAGCKAPIVVDPATGTVSLEPLYYALAHFSRYVRRGARRIGSTTFSPDIQVAAFQNPDRTIVAVLLNAADADTPVTLRLDGQTAPLVLPGHSLATLVIPQ